MYTDWIVILYEEESKAEREIAKVGGGMSAGVLGGQRVQVDGVWIDEDPALPRGLGLRQVRTSSALSGLAGGRALGTTHEPLTSRCSDWPVERPFEQPCKPSDMSARAVGALCMALQPR
jgi:hypothetical protein